MEAAAEPEPCPELPAHRALSVAELDRELDSRSELVRLGRGSLQLPPGVKRRRGRGSVCAGARPAVAERGGLAGGS